MQITFQGNFFGFYQDGVEEKIRLATPSEKTFFHELGHAAHRRVKGKLTRGQEPRQEIVAELSAQVLAQLVGTEIKSTLGNSYEYISWYATLIGKSVEHACLGVLGDIEKVLKLILDV